MGIFFHSVTLDESKCVGCTNCIKRCPTEAIRVRSGKAVIMSERCIDCGECIRICPHHAKRAKHDHLSMLEKFTYKIALPAPSLYGQFNNLDDQDYVLSGLKKLGFDDVMEVSGAAELVSEATRRLMDAGTLQRPVISSACPAVVRLIRVRFPDLCDHVLPLLSPMETAARIAKQQAMQKTGLPKEQIGCFFITPCPAKVTDIRMPIGIEKSEVDGAIAISEIFPQLSSRMDKLTPKDLESLSNSGIIGVSWATSGGVLCVENPYVAIARLQRLRKYLPVSQNHLEKNKTVPEEMNWGSGLEFSNVLTLSEDISRAMEMMMEIDKVEAELPGLDCGACGAPSCRAFAEDTVRGSCRKEDCVFILRKEIRRFADSLSNLDLDGGKRTNDDE